MNDWTPVDGFPNYSVNSLGQVRQDRFDRLMTPHANQTSSVYVSLMKNAVQYQRSLALIVAKAFLPTPSPPFDTPIHLNGDKWDCRVENLMWRPRWFAIRYHRQFTDAFPGHIEAPLRARGDHERFPDSLTAASRYGLLEKDVVGSIRYNTYAWPTYQIFERVI
jgi:HNH endonuclease